MMLRLTWVAPEIKSLPRLAWLTELGDLQNIPNVQVVACTGPSLTRADVARALSNPADLVLWSGHGEAGCLALSENMSIKPHWLALQVKNANPRLVVLAGCSTMLRDSDLKSMAELCCRQGLNTIGLPAEAADNDVVRFNVELVRALAANSEIGDAFDVALEEVEGTKLAEGIFLLPGLRNTYPNFNVRLMNLENQFVGLRADIRSLMDWAKIPSRSVDQVTGEPPSVLSEGTVMRGSGKPRQANGHVVGLRARK